MIRTQIQFSEEQIQALKDLSAAADESVAELVRRAVDQFLVSRAHSTRARRVQKALSVVGKYSSGLSDVSAKHDRYLEEAFRS